MSRRLLEQDLDAAAPPPAQHYTAPAPPLPDSVQRSMDEHAKRANRTAADQGQPF